MARGTQAPGDCTPEKSTPACDEHIHLGRGV
jgi:hypothetical protein